MLQNPPPKASWPAFDLIKCGAVMGMVLVHSFYWSWTRHGQLLVPAGSFWYRVYDNGMFLGICPMALPLLAGVALRLRVAAERPGTLPGRGPRLRRTLSGLALQGAVLAACGYAMNVLAAGWAVLWAWNVLQLIALSSFVIGILYAAGGIRPVLAAGVLILAMTEPLRGLIPVADRGAVLHVLLGDAWNWHQWPVFPWSATVAFGFALAELYLTVGKTRFALSCGGIGLGSALAGAALGHIGPVLDPKDLIGIGIMQPPAVDLLGLTGVVLLVFAALKSVQDRLHFSRRGIVHCFSGGILTIYLAHMVVGDRLYGLIFGQLDHAALVATVTESWHPVLMIGFPALLLLLSWWVGYVTIVWVHNKRLRIRLRRREITRA